MIYVTGDTHGSYRRLRRFFNRKPVGKDDILIVLGDTGLNYYGDDRDVPHRKSAARLPLTLLCLRGNHDRHPASLPANRAEKRFGGLVYADEQYLYGRKVCADDRRRLQYRQAMAAATRLQLVFR